MTRAPSIVEPTTPYLVGPWKPTAVAFSSLAVTATLVALLTGPWLAGAWLTAVASVVAPLAAASAAFAARSEARAEARPTWTAIAVACLCAAVGEALALRFPGASFPAAPQLLAIALHVGLAIGAVLALRPARDRRLAVEIALDGLLVLLSAAILVIRLQLDPALSDGWITLGEGAALLVGQISVVGSLLFCALLVVWRDSELGALPIDLLFIAALLFSFGDALVASWLGAASPSPLAFVLLRLAGWAALVASAATAWRDRGPTLATSGRTAVARRMRLLVIPAAVLFLATWAAIGDGGVAPSRLGRATMSALGLALALRVGAALYGGEREAEERQAADARAARARIRAITAQMSPHFLFNTLHSLSALLRRDPAVAESVLERLGGLLRYGLDRGDEPVSLDDEWRFTRSYLEVEQVRLGDRLTVEADMQPDALDRLVPPFIVQPLVENAVRHSIDADPKGGRISVSARVGADDLLTIEVRDSGLGADPEQLWSASGVGVRGVRAQLAAHLEDRARMETERVPGGFVVRLVVPQLED